MTEPKRRTLQDYLMSGGVKGKHFVATRDYNPQESSNRQTYRIISFYGSPEEELEITNMNISLDGRRKSGADYAMPLSPHLKDVEARPEEITRPKRRR